MTSLPRRQSGNGDTRRLEVSFPSILKSSRFTELIKKDERENNYCYKGVGVGRGFPGEQRAECPRVSHSQSEGCRRWVALSPQIEPLI